MTASQGKRKSHVSTSFDLERVFEQSIRDFLLKQNKNPNVFRFCWKHFTRKHDFPSNFVTHFRVCPTVWLSLLLFFKMLEQQFQRGQYSQSFFVRRKCGNEERILKMKSVDEQRQSLAACDYWELNVTRASRPMSLMVARFSVLTLFVSCVDVVWNVFADFVPQCNIVILRRVSVFLWMLAYARSSDVDFKDLVLHYAISCCLWRSGSVRVRFGFV